MTFERERVSRDPTTWVALGTYGHPRLPELLDQVAASEDEITDAALVIAEDEAATKVDVNSSRARRHPRAERSSTDNRDVADAEIMSEPRWHRLDIPVIQVLA